MSYYTSFNVYKLNHIEIKKIEASSKIIENCQVYGDHLSYLYAITNSSKNTILSMRMSQSVTPSSSFPARFDQFIRRYLPSELYFTHKIPCALHLCNCSLDKNMNR